MGMGVFVQVHGYHPEGCLDDGQTWDETMFGLEDGKPTLRGRVSMGLRVMLKRDARRIILSNGAKEGDVFRRIEQLAPKLETLLRIPARNTLLDILYARRHIDNESENTTEECERGIRAAALAEAEELILVSSPWHSPRCLTQAQEIAEAMRARGEYAPEVTVRPSFGSMMGTIIFEPRHRAGQVSFLKTVSRLPQFHGKPEVARELDRKLNKAIDEHEEKLKGK